MSGSTQSTPSKTNSVPKHNKASSFFTQKLSNHFKVILVIKSYLPLLRYWLQFNAEDGLGSGSAMSLDNISFSMDCFLACEFYKNLIFSSLVFSTWLWLRFFWQCLIYWVSRAKWMVDDELSKIDISLLFKGFIRKNKKNKRAKWTSALYLIDKNNWAHS